MGTNLRIVKTFISMVKCKNNHEVLTSPYNEEMLNKLSIYLSLTLQYSMAYSEMIHI